MKAISPMSVFLFPWLKSARIELLRKGSNSLVTLTILGALFCRGYASERHFLREKLYSTKTPYDHAKALFAGFLTDRYGIQHAPITDDRKSPSTLTYPKQCTPIQLSVLLRHGTRYPSGGDVKKLQRFLDKWNTIDVHEQYLATKNWTNDFTYENEKKLGEAGATENVNIAQRLTAAFPDLFYKSFVDSSNFELMASDTQRTIASAEGFIQGLSASLGVHQADLSSKLQLRNDLLRFFDACKSYNYKVDDSDASLDHYNKFQTGEEMLEASRRVSSRVTLQGLPDILSPEDLRAIWVLCGYERALYPAKGSAWCDLLTVEDTATLEYAADLKSFWRKSFGFTLNYEQSCPLLSDMMKNLFHAATDKNSPGVSLYFGHAETLLPLQALLGLFQDEQPLLFTNFHDHKDTRKFRTSLTASFASNVGIVLYECQEGEQTTHAHWPRTLKKHMVQIFVNEHAIPLPFAVSLAVSFEEFEHEYYQFVHHCDFDGMCQNAKKIKDEL